MTKFNPTALPFLLLLVFCSAVARAELTTFAAGNPVRAAEMNGNFTQLQEQIGVNTEAIAAQLEAINTIELIPGPAGPQGDPGVAVSDVLCQDGGSVQGFENGLPVCSRAADRCDAGLIQGGWAYGCDFSGRTFEDLDFFRGHGSFMSFKGASISSTMPIREETTDLPNVLNTSVRRAQNAFGMGTYIGADFRGASLSDMNFFYARMTIADFSDAVLSDSGTLTEAGTLIRTNFQGAEVSAADFSRAILDNTFLFRTDGISSKFTDASFQNGFALESTLYDADFSGANLSGTWSTGSRFLWTDFTGATMHGGGIPAAVLIGADLSDSSIDGAGFWLSNLGLSHLRNVIEVEGGAASDFTQSNMFRAVIQGSSLSDASFSFALLHAASIQDSQFVGSRFGGADLRLVNRWDPRSGAQFTGEEDTGNFSDAWMESADLRAAALPNSVFDRAFLGNTDLRGSDFSNSSFVDANMTSALLATTFTDATMDGSVLNHGRGWVNFVRTSCINCQMAAVFLVDSDFTDANLTGANFRHATVKAGSLVNVNFTDADLGGVDGIDLADVTGAIWSNTLCPDFTNSDDNGGTCVGHMRR